MNLGNINNASVSFGISRRQGTEIDNLDIAISSRIDTDFVCRVIINGITPNDIDKLCHKLQSLKTKLIERRNSEKNY